MPRKPRPHPPAVGRMVELVTRSRGRVSLAELSTEVGLSKSHLVREFARHVGAPPLRYQNLRRLRRAAELLRAGQKPVEVAHRLGYADQAHFNRLFKKHFGMPPGAYARAHRRRVKPEPEGA